MKKNYITADAQIFMSAAEDILNSSTDAGKDNLVGVDKGFFVGYPDELEIG